MEDVSLIQRGLIGWTLMDEMKGKDWLYLEINWLLKWFGWIENLKIYKMQINGSW